jgi:hypothetical protein
VGSGLLTSIYWITLNIYNYTELPQLQDVIAVTHNHYKIFSRIYEPISPPFHNLPIIQVLSYKTEVIISREQFQWLQLIMTSINVFVHFTCRLLLASLLGGM